MKLKELKQKVELIPGLTDKQKAEIACTLVGHSSVVNSCFGEVSCARCGTVVGDCLLGFYDTVDLLIVGHECPDCFKAYKKLTPADKFMVDLKPTVQAFKRKGYMK